MNSKKAKALRKVLRNLEKTNQNLATETTYVEHENKRKVMHYEDIDENGNTVEKSVLVAGGQQTVNPISKRGLYKKLKKEMKKSQ